ncbi:MAG: 6,7-dimethyl-8-ribityllumazine synthase [Verrucomicrobiales bacterium]
MASLYNEDYVNALVEATNQELLRIIPNAAIPLYRVPGAFEIPVCAEFLMQNTEIDALIALGVVIRGETAHADLVATSVTNSLQQMSTTHLIPIINEVLLLDDEEQARVRCLSPDYNRGIEAARATVNVCELFSKLYIAHPPGSKSNSKANLAPNG